MTTSTVAPAAELTGTWDIDPAHTRLAFAAKHAMVTTVRGGFTAFGGTLELDAADPTRAGAEVTIDAASFTSGNEQRDAHVRSADFLDVESFPTLGFRSTRVEPRGDGAYRMYGDLTVKDVTREVALDVEFAGVTVDPWGNLRAGFEGSTTINRKDWGLTWNVALEAGGILVSDKVRIELDVAATKRV